MKDRDISYTQKMFQSDMGNFDKVKKVNPPPTSSYYRDPNLNHGIPPMGYPPMYPNPMMYPNPYMPPPFYGSQHPQHPPPYYYDQGFYKPQEEEYRQSNPFPQKNGNEDNNIHDFLQEVLVDKNNT